MRFSIPVTALITLLVNTSDSLATLQPLLDQDSHLSIPDKNNNFSCNEPFMIPAEYIDPQGNSFAMCFSDPLFHRKNVIWYIQAMTGSFKAVGVARRKGAGEFVGTVIPIEQSSNSRSVMNSEPVAVRVHLDRSSGVISVSPRDTEGQLINWVIRPNGFPAGSLKVPESCGRFLKPLKNRKLLSPLTGAGRKSKVCVIPSGHGDAFISWGHYKHHDDHQVDPLALDGGISHKFFSMGFVDVDRGVSIDICDPGNGDANRCEMSRLVGHTRKTFVVGSGKDDDLEQFKLNNGSNGKYRRDRQNRPKRHHRRHAHEVRSEALIKRIEMIERDLNSILQQSEVDNVDRPVTRRHRKNHRHRGSHSHRKSHSHRRRRAERNDLVEPTDNLRNEATRRDALIDGPADTNQREDIYRRRLDNKIDHPIDRDNVYRQRINENLCSRKLITDEKPVDPRRYDDTVVDETGVFRRHRRRSRSRRNAKQCPVHPLIRPAEPEFKVAAVSPSPAQPAPLIHPEIRRHQTESLHHFNRLHTRLNHLDSQLDQAESIIASRLLAFNRWLHRQRLGIEDRAKDFVDYLARLKADVVYTPKSTKKTKKHKKSHNFFKKLGRTFHGTKKSDKDLFDGNDDDNTSNRHSIFSSLKDTTKKVTDSTVNLAKGTVGTAENILDGTVGGARNVLDTTVNGAGNVLDSTVGGAGNFVGNTVGGTRNILDNTVNGAGNLISAPVAVTGNILDKTVSTTGNVLDTTVNGAGNILDRTVNGAGNLISAPVAATGKILDTTVGTTGNILDTTVGTASNLVSSSARTVGSVAAGTVNAVTDTTGSLIDPIVRPVAPPRAVAVSDRFDLNDDLLPPARASLARAPDYRVAAADPLGPGGPVLPPPAVAKYKNDPIRDAIDYLN